MNLRPFVIIVPALLALLAAGCAIRAPHASNGVPRMGKVAVVSVTGHTFHRLHAGLTVFHNEQNQMDVSDWGIDDLIESSAADELRSRHGMKVVTVPGARAAFQRVNELNATWDDVAMWGSNWAEITPAVKSQCESHQLDGVLVVAKTRMKDFLSGTTLVLDGLGIFSRSLVSQGANLHFLARVALYDCPAGKPVATRLLASKQPGDKPAGLPGLSWVPDPSSVLKAAGDWRTSVPLTPLLSEPARTPLAELTAERRDELKTQSRRLAVIALPATLDSIFTPNP